jgi:hypothetical protein
MVLRVFSNVVGRYGFGAGFAGAEEVARLLFVWLVFLGAILALRRRAHLGVELVVQRLPAGLRRACAVVCLPADARCVRPVPGGQLAADADRPEHLLRYPNAFTAASGLVCAASMILIVGALMVQLDFFNAQLVAQNMLAGADIYPLMAVPCFILAGELMNAGGISRRIINLAVSMVGHIPGGLGYVAIAATLLLDCFSGSALADTAAVATLLIPMMRKNGYPVPRSAGLIAAGVGFIALAGVAAEFGVVMLLYLKHALQDRLAAGAPPSAALVDDAIREGAVLRVRPKAMAVAVILAGLLPIVWGSGTGSEVMSRIAAPMLGGMVTAPLLSLFIVPAVYALLRRRGSSTPG